MDAAAVQKLMLGLPGVEEHEGWAGQPAFKVKNKGFVYLSGGQTSADAEGPARGAGGDGRGGPRRLRAVLVREAASAGLEADLAAADEDELRELLTEAWRLTAPKYLIAQLDERP